MLFFIQLGASLRAPVALLFSPDGALMPIPCNRHTYPVAMSTKLFSPRVEPTGMLAPKAQATTIRLRVRRGHMGVNGEGEVGASV